MFLVWQQGNSMEALEEAAGPGSKPLGERHRIVVVQASKELPQPQRAWEVSDV